jgi:hypothetical protein
MVFQHDGAPPHFNHAVVEHLNVHFPAATEIRDNSVDLHRATCTVHKRLDKCFEAREAFLKTCCNLCELELQTIKSTEINLFLCQ